MLAGRASLTYPEQSPDMGSAAFVRDVHPWVLAELLMQKQGTTEVGHLGCVIQDALEQSEGGGEEGGEKTES